jgi:hypothetical protein
VANKICGIVGIIPKYKLGILSWHTDIFSQLLYADQLRGTDGTGFFFDTADHTSICKAPAQASDFLTYPEVEAALTEATKISTFLIGHNRAATKGNKVWKDTHPFREGPITLVHNGTLSSHKDIADVDVDSHAICVGIAERGYKETLKTIDGAFALVWYNSDEEKLYLVRNNLRPLFLVETQGYYIICSENALGVWIAERNNSKVLNVIEVEAGQLHTFDKKDMRTFTKEKVDFLPPPVHNYIGKWKGNHKTEQHSASCGSSTQVSTRPTHPIRLYGDTIQFSPKPLNTVNILAETAICYDSKRKQHFMLCTIPGETDTEVRYYGKEKHMRQMSDKPFLRGKIITTMLKGPRVIYGVFDVVEVVKPNVVIAGAATEVCHWCFADITPETRATGSRGEHLCLTCAATLERHFDTATWPDPIRIC